MGEKLRVFSFLLRQFCAGILRTGNLFAENDLGGTLCPHHRNFCGGPRKDQVGPDVPGIHHVVGPSIGLSCDHCDPGYGGFAEGIEQFGAIRDDAIPFLVGARQKARHIFQHHKWHIEGVTRPHKARRLDRRIVVEHSRQKRRLIGHNSHTLTCQATKTHHHVFCKIWLHFHEGTFVHNLRDRIPDVIGLLGALWHQPIQVGPCLIFGIVGQPRRIFFAILRQVPKRTLGLFNDQGLVRSGEVGDPRLGGVGARAPQLF